MAENKGVIETLGDYMTLIFDKDKDGIVTAKELLGVFPNHAVAVAVIFVDLLVLVAEYRVADFGYMLTGNVYKAIGFVLVSAIPFYLGQLFWLYPRAVLIQKIIVIAFIGVSLYTSYSFGAADLTKTYDEAAIFNFMLQLTAGYIVGTLSYIVIDPSIKANRAKKIAQDKADFEKELQGIARQVLQSLKETMETQRGIAKDFGASEAEKAMNLLHGRKPEKQPQVSYAADVERIANKPIKSRQEEIEALGKQMQDPK